MNAEKSDLDPLLCGFQTLLESLLEAEADYLCSARRCQHTSARLNYRNGYHKRKIRTHLGYFPISVPQLRYIYLRVSMPKRATRLGAEIIGILRQMLDGGVTDMHLAALVKMVWTIGLSEELLTELVQSLSRRMNAWRAHATGESARDMSAASLDSCMAIGMPGLV